MMGGGTMDLFRSEEMQLMQVSSRLSFASAPCVMCCYYEIATEHAVLALQLMMPAESAHDTVAALGEVGLLQFKDLNFEKSGFQRAFASQVRSSTAAQLLIHQVRVKQLRCGLPCSATFSHWGRYRSSAVMRWPGSFASSPSRSQAPYAPLRCV